MIRRRRGRSRWWSVSKQRGSRSRGRSPADVWLFRPFLRAVPANLACRRSTLAAVPALFAHDSAIIVGFYFRDIDDPSSDWREFNMIDHFLKRILILNPQSHHLSRKTATQSLEIMHKDGRVQLAPLTGLFIYTHYEKLLGRLRCFWHNPKTSIYLTQNMHPCKGITAFDKNKTNPGLSKPGQDILPLA